MDPEDVRPLWAALRNLDPERAAGPRTERRRLGLGSEPLDRFEMPHGLAPKAVWTSRQSGRPTGWVVFEREIFPQPHPGTSEVGLTFLDAHGGVRARDSFDTGYRRYLRQARLEPVTGFDGPVVRVETVGFMGQNPVRQFYTVVEDRFVFIRLETGDGSVARNPYRYVHAGAAPVLRRSADEWETDLGSRDRGRVLRALIWLGRVQPGLLRSATDIEPTRAVRARPGVAARLRQLADSSEAWERDAAQLALELDAVQAGRRTGNPD
jgi:hypothetical protein